MIKAKVLSLVIGALVLVVTAGVIKHNSDRSIEKRMQDMHDEMLIRTCSHVRCGFADNEGGTWWVCCYCNMHIKPQCVDYVTGGRMHVRPHRIYGVVYAYIPHEEQ